MHVIQDMLVSLYDADTWADDLLPPAIYLVFITSSVILYRMLRYKGKNRLDYAFIFREIAWWLLGFLFSTSLALGWNWTEISWIVWAVIVISQIGVLVEQQREYYLGGQDDSNME